ncbi:hypothetical protein HYH02_014015 [Chlamydomonas schloesseri]|uniref:Protein kinase domain-containing protein n=1 Tax=Chlamydomonas schloesseri TaxID=2026947 RepID=A0A835SQW0_9CHLO|nr:hypothetical protein HYH02_014015 [Chlamydomonas schloesseri]|eukprot:KAG2429677.1 hypothetical protein HYH02_014015 [Chlamydomonas schloesseri]
MADSQATEPATGSNANTHFFRPNDGIYVSEGVEQRTICVSPHLPPSMSRNGTDWHVEQFELHKELYRGKTSLLYMATDRISGVQVALKLYRKRKLSVLNRYQVEREVRLHINLHHENIIHLFAAFEDEKHVYMVQEFAVCGDLFEDLKKGGGQLKEKYAVRDVIVPFLSALSYLHSMGIIHRDIKPENILLGANKVIKVADFGLSINIHHERPVTRAGTLDYMAPEVLVCPDKRRPEENKDKVLLGYTAQVDSWAVGILAYELLVGYPPFEQESRAATYEHIMYKEPKFPSWMSEEARRFINLALCKNATQRPSIADLLAHGWVQPYLVRHPHGVGGTGTAGPSRLRNSVSMAVHDTAASPSPSINAGAAAPAASSASSQPAQPARASTMSVGSTSQPPTGSGMAPAPSAGAGAAASALANGGLGRMMVQLPSQPPVQRSSSYMMMTHADSSAGLSPRQAGGGTSGGGASPGIVTVARSPQPHSHGAAISPVAGGGGGGLGPHAGGAGGYHHQQQYGAGAQSLNSSTGLKDPITGNESRLHDSISDPTIRSFEPQPPQPQLPHHLMPAQPPGAVSAAALHQGGGSGGGVSRSGGGGADGLERANSGLSGLVGSSSAAYVLGGARAPAALGGPSQGNLGSRLGLSSHSVSRPSPPPLALTESMDALSSDASCAGGVGGADSTGGYTPIPLSPSGLMPLPPGTGRSGLASAGGARTVSGAAGPGTPPAPGLRHRVVPPGINTANLGIGGGGGGSTGGGRLPAPPASPKPLTPDLTPGFHRPASGVLSDDSFLPPARSPSMSMGAQHLSPLQAALMVPRPSLSRLNSPSHSRRNSLSQAGNAPGANGPTSGGFNVPLHSTPLPQLPGDTGCGGDGGSLCAEDSRSSTSHRYVGGGTSSSGVGVGGGAAGGGGNGGGSRMLGKLWPGAAAGGGGGGLESPMDMPTSSGASFSSRGGGGGGGAGGAGANASPMARTAAMAARVRMLAPEDLRPLMRESSISSGTPKGGSNAGGDLRAELAQPSMTVYSRPGKVPGVGRAAIAAREAEAAEAAASLSAASAALNKTKSLVNRNLNGVLGEEGGGPCGLARMGSDVALARTAAGQAAAAAAAAPAVASQRSFTGANSAFARKLANGAIATKVTEYVKGRLPHDEDMDD